MAAPTGYPSWVYNSTQLSSLIVQNVAAFTALGGLGTWTTTPYSTTSSTADANFSITDTYLKNLLIEARVQNYMLQGTLGIVDDVQSVIRPDVAVNDVALTAL